MSKRKWEETENEDVARAEKREWRIKVSRFKGKIFQGHKSLTSALKLARGFERQKMGRRQKQAANDPARLLRLREEVIVLREMDLSKVARTYLLKQMTRSKQIRESALFCSVYGPQPNVEGAKTQAEANVLGLLFKSNPVIQVLPNIMQGVREILGLSDTQSTPNTADYRPPHSNKTQVNGVSQQIVDIGNAEFREFSDQALESPDILAAKISNAGVKDTAENSSLDRFAEDSDEKAVKSDELLRADNIGDISVSSSASGDEADSVEMDQNSRLSALSRNVRQQKAISKTAFLPSLSMGGYYSGSESEDGHLDEIERNNPSNPRLRKNRRGQRERQKIAERKFGRDANHLQKQSNQSHREDGWDPRRGATVNSQKKHSFKDHGREEKSKKPNISASNLKLHEIHTSSRHRTGVDAPIHPSWEAARQRKADKSMAEFSGKKITFD